MQWLYAESTTCSEREMHNGSRVKLPLCPAAVGAEGPQGSACHCLGEVDPHQATSVAKTILFELLKPELCSHSAGHCHHH